MTAATDAAAAKAQVLRAAATDAEVAACWPLMRLLRPHLASREEFLERVARQRAEGYRLLAV